MEFAPGVTENLGYYVYTLLDPKDPRCVLYVGKGIGNRVHAHVAWASKADDLKSKAIREIKTATGMDPIHIIAAHGLTEETAFLLESVLIETHRSPFLLNRVRGHGHEKHCLDVEEINSMYGARTVRAEDVEHPTIFVSLNGGKVPGAAYPNIKGDAHQLMERSLGIWKVSDWRANRILQVAAVYGGIVRAVYAVSGWDEAEHPKGKRKRFIPNGGFQPRSPLLGARVVDKDGVCITDFMYGREKAYAGF
jgi:hypothetical protein